MTIVGLVVSTRIDRLSVFYRPLLSVAFETIVYAPSFKTPVVNDQKVVPDAGTNGPPFTLTSTFIKPSGSLAVPTSSGVASDVKKVDSPGGGTGDPIAIVGISLYLDKLLAFTTMPSSMPPSWLYHLGVRRVAIGRLLDHIL